MTTISHAPRAISQIHIVDVFAERKYAGNQLAVVSGAASIDDVDMQRIARETNFSETTFILSDRPRAGGHDVRIFTPAAEIPFAGHPTIGTAWVLRNEVLRSTEERIVLNLKIGPVPVRFERQGDGRDLLWMTTPYPQFGQTFDPGPLSSLLGLAPADVDDRLPVEEVSLGVPFTFVPLRTLDAVRRARFRNDEYERLQHLGFNPCIYLFCQETYDAAHQINARMFAEVFGVKEDPATGSATACLAAYILQHNVCPGDAIDLKVEQGYEINRPSLLFLRAERNGAAADIRVGGHVVPTIRGSLS
jgi:trans-2,3-dihydro-3-hydroxyanthranilate isomerase